MKELFFSKKFKIVFYSITGFLLLYSVLGFLILPAIILNQAPKFAMEKLSRVLEIEDIQFNPFSMELAMQGFDLKNTDSDTFTSIKRLYIDVAVWQSIFDLSLKMAQVTIKHPYAFIQRNKQGDFNFTDLLTNDQPKPEQESTDDNIFPVTISQIKIVEGKLRWEDDFYSKIQREDIYPLNLSIDNFTTKININSQLGFALNFASGGQFNWQGKLQLNPFESNGQIKLDKVNFPKLWALFLQDSVNFEILKGTELIEASYQLADTKEGMQLLVNNAHVDIIDLQLAEKNAKNSLISVPDFKVSGVSVNLLKKTVEITTVSANDALFKAWLNTDGSLNYQSLFTTKSENKTEEKQAPQANQPANNTEEGQWLVLVKQLALNNFDLHFIDKSLATPAKLNLTSLNLNVTDITNKSAAALPFNLGLTFNDTGSLKVNGQAVLEPFSSNLQLDLSKISIKDFQPYIDTFARLDVISGLFNIKANISLIQNNDKPLGISLQGNSKITNLVTRDKISNKDFLNWKQLSLKKMDIDLATNKYTIDTVKIIRPYAKVLIRKDQSMNVNDIMINTSNDKKTTIKHNNKAKKESVKPYFKIGRIEMIDGESDFADLSLILPFSAHLNKLNGTVKGISSEKNATTRVALKGRVGGLAPVKITGQFNPSRGNSEVSLDFKSMSLPLVTPYMAEFAGRKIEKGNMSLKLNYKINNNQLSASNNLLIDQLTLGDEVENPDAVSLPLGLAIALLEDADGKIVLDVPIKGSLEDPDFSIAGIVVDALVNVITKVISAPFNAIASLIGSDEDISKISFSSGNALLSNKQQEKLNGLATALLSRPGLKLEIKGTAYSQHDWPLLQNEALYKLLLQTRSEELNKDNNTKVLAENVQLDEKEYLRLVTDLFFQKFPQLAEKSLFGTPSLIDQSQGDFYPFAKQKLASSIPPDHQRLRSLATLRAQTIAKHLIDNKIPIERMYLLDVDVDPSNTEKTIATLLNLTVD